MASVITSLMKRDSTGQQKVKQKAPRSLLGSSQATILAKLRSKRSPKAPPPKQIISPAHPHTDLEHIKIDGQYIPTTRDTVLRTASRHTTF